MSPIPNNMVLAIVSIVVSIFGCCLPHGIVSLVFAMQVGKKEAAGDIDGATKASKQAKMFGWVSIGVGIIGAIVWILVFGVSGLLALVGR